MTATLLSLTAKAVSGLLLAVVVGALAVLTVVPRAVGGAALTVLTGSMTPTIAVGSVVVVRPVDPGTLRAGDVVTYQRTPGRADYVTHRIVAVHAGTTPVTLTTKGDANRAEDTEPVPVTAVRGRVMFWVPHLGTAKSAISTGSAGLLLLVVALVAYAVAQVASVLRDRRRAGAAQAPPPVEGLQLELLVVVLPLAGLDHLAPTLVASLLGMDVVDRGADLFTATAVGDATRLDALADRLVAFSPVLLQRSASVRVPRCPTAPEEALRVAA